MGDEEFKFNCPTPNCPQNYTATPDMVGTTFDCPSCGANHQIPEGPTESVVPDPVAETHPYPGMGIEIKKLAGPPNTPEGNYYEIAYAENDLRRFEGIPEIKELAISGEITRHNPCRHIYPKPAENEEHQVETWRIEREWRPIGESLALNAFELQPLYDPVAASRSRWAAGFMMVGMIGVLILMFCSPFGQSIMGNALDKANQALADTDGGMARLVAWAFVGAIHSWPLIVALIIGTILSNNIGSSLGFLIGADTVKKAVLAPEDGYVSDSQAIASAGFINSQGRAITVFILSAFLMLGGVGFMVTKGGESKIAAITFTPSTWEPYSDPKGRFQCLIPEGWNLEDKKEAERSNILLSSGGTEIRIIARHTNFPEVYDEMEDELRAGFAQAQRQAGKSAHDRGIVWRTTNGHKAVQAELEIESPDYMWVRMVKFKESNNDHTVGAYIASEVDKDKLVELFELFLENYKTFGAPSNAPE